MRRPQIVLIGTGKLLNPGFNRLIPKGLLDAAYRGCT